MNKDPSKPVALAISNVPPGMVTIAARSYCRGSKSHHAIVRERQRRTPVFLDDVTTALGLGRDQHINDARCVRNENGFDENSRRRENGDFSRGAAGAPDEDIARKIDIQ